MSLTRCILQEDTNSEFAKQLQELQEKLTDRDEQLVDKQVKLDQLQAKVKVPHLNIYCHVDFHN